MAGRADQPQQNENEEEYDEDIDNPEEEVDNQEEDPNPLTTQFQQQILAQTQLIIIIYLNNKIILI